jgi:transposase
MDQLIGEQRYMEKKLAARHLKEGGIALYDLSSSYFEGTECKLAARGRDRDGKKGKLQVNYGLLSAQSGGAVAISVFPGNTAHSTTFMPQVATLRRRFGLERVVLVGDRGMISHKAIDELREMPGVSWVTALKSVQIRALVQGGALRNSPLALRAPISYNVC